VTVTRGWRSDATTNTNRDTRTQGFGVRELRQARRHTNASQAEEEKTGDKAEVEQAEGLAFSLSASLAFRSLPLLSLSSEAFPSQATACDLRAHNSESFGVRQLAPVIAEGLLIKVTEQMERFHTDIGPVQLSLD
jgi:hypothetical protein